MPSIRQLGNPYRAWCSAQYYFRGTSEPTSIPLTEAVTAPQHQPMMPLPPVSMSGPEHKAEEQRRKGQDGVDIVAAATKIIAQRRLTRLDGQASIAADQGLRRVSGIATVDSVVAWVAANWIEGRQPR